MRRFPETTPLPWPEPVVNGRLSPTTVDRRYDVQTFVDHHGNAVLVWNRACHANIPAVVLTSTNRPGHPPRRRSRHVATESVAALTPPRFYNQGPGRHPRHPLLAVYVAVGVASTMLQSFIYVLCVLNPAAAALALHALYHLVLPPAHAAPRHSRRFDRVVAAILASTIAYLTTHLAYRITS